jgi:pyruvate ferredoxin oxidoreductase gamma subunit
MFQIRIHGRGGQGVVSAAEILSVAAFDEGKYAQAFPSFGSERTGAPVMSFCRIDDKPIRMREPVLHPDALIIQDATLLHLPGLCDGLAEDGFVLINSSQERDAREFEGAACPAEHRLAVGATELALKHLGRPLPNAALLGAFAALTGALRIEAILEAIRDKFPGKIGELNAAAAQDAYRTALEARMEAHATAN